MDVQAIMTAISTVGFPIVACCGLFWFANKLVDKITSVISENTKVISENTATINELKTSLESEN